MVRSIADCLFIPESFTNKTLWKDVLTCWLRFQVTYEKDVDDVSYWHSEQALNGLLGAAVWGVKGWSLEEFSAGRGRRATKSNGRGDLWFGRGEEKVTVEAKICWIDESVGNPEKQLLRTLRESQHQLEELEQDCKFGQLVSVSYVVPWFSKPKRKASGINALEILEQYSRSQGMATAKHVATIQDIEDKGRKYPGVLLVVKDQSRSCVVV